MNASRRSWAEIFHETARYYFAPIVGAIRGIREEYRRLDEEYAAKYQAIPGHERRGS